ncbi:MAG: hydroxyphenylacetyl-CoA thioesterase PaaI [Rhizobiaceae bacterium]
MTDADETANQMARACADKMWAQDQASQQLGMQIDQIAPGFARLSMTIRPEMTNGLDIAHGGLIFTLADSTFAFACNTYNQFVVAQSCTINFISSARGGDRLTATAVERNRSGRSGIYDVTVTNQNDEVVAEFRGNSRTIKGQHLSS